jgi:pimeloyl-ACP methyl ester carboxylesterase
MLASRSAGHGPTVLLVHGWSGFKEAWGDLPDALAGAGRRALAVDLPGWGETPDPPGFAHRPQDYADVLEPTARRDGPIDVVAHSMGTQAALLLALRPPARVRRLVLISPAAVPAAPAAGLPGSLAELVALPVVGGLVLALTLGWLRWLPERVWLDILKKIVADPDRAAADPRLESLAHEAAHRFRHTHTRVLARAYRAAAATDLRPLAPGAPQPTLVVIGERDTTVHPGEAVSLSGALPAGRMLRVPRAAHLPHLERPDLVVPAVVAHVVGG